MDNTPAVVRVSETGTPTIQMELPDGGAGGCTGGARLRQIHGSSFHVHMLYLTAGVALKRDRLCAGCHEPGEWNTSAISVKPLLTDPVAEESLLLAVEYRPTRSRGVACTLARCFASLRTVSSCIRTAFSRTNFLFQRRLLRRHPKVSQSPVALEFAYFLRVNFRHF